MKKTATVLVLLALWAWPGRVEAWTTPQCLEASEAGQQARKQGRYFNARRSLELCAHASCPAVVQTECTRWLDELLNEMPTVVVVVRLDGVDQPRARVTLDGLPWLEDLTGTPHDVEPGEHQLLVETAGVIGEQRFVANVGEKHRRVVFELSRPAGARVSRPAPVVPLVASGLAVVGTGLFTGFGLSGRAGLDRLVASECAATRTCAPASVALVRRNFLIADVSLAVAAVSAVVAAWQWWRWTGLAPEPPVSVLVGPGGIGLAGRF